MLMQPVPLFTGENLSRLFVFDDRFFVTSGVNVYARTCRPSEEGLCDAILPGDDGLVNTVACCNRNGTVYTGMTTTDNLLRKWQFNALKGQIKLSSPVKKIAVHPSGTHVVAACLSGTLHFLYEAFLIPSGNFKHGNTVEDVSFSPDGKLLASSWPEIRIWRVVLGRWLSVNRGRKWHDIELLPRRTYREALPCKGVIFLNDRTVAYSCGCAIHLRDVFNDSLTVIKCPIQCNNFAICGKKIAVTNGQELAVFDGGNTWQRYNNCHSKYVGFLNGEVVTLGKNVVSVWRSVYRDPPDPLKAAMNDIKLVRGKWMSFSPKTW